MIGEREKKEQVILIFFQIIDRGKKRKHLKKYIYIYIYIYINKIMVRVSLHLLRKTMRFVESIASALSLGYKEWL
jgi:hypothetical protein